MNTARIFLVFLLAFTATPAKAGYTLPLFGSRQNILLIGDSLSVGPFGREMQSYLTEEYGENRVFIYAACGSSPENWLDSEPSFLSKCGARVKTPRLFVHTEYEKGRPPEPFATPKLTPVLRSARPNVVLVQLGTNWFDVLEGSSSPEALNRLAAILERFADTILNSDSHPTLVWITPPDSERYRRVQADVTKMICSIGQRKKFRTIDSSKMVHYVMGQSGGDGIHYYGPDALKWADAVKTRLKRIL